MAFIEECSAIIQNKLQPTLKDPRSFSIPCAIDGSKFFKALCDLGASVSLILLFATRKLGLKDIQPTTITLQLTDRTIQHLIGIIEDVLVKLGHLYIPVDFLVLEIEEDVDILVIFGRPFLVTSGIIIDVKEGKITFKVGEEVVEFNIFNAIKHLASSISCFRMDVDDEDKGMLISPPISDQAPSFGLNLPPL
ncbi:PREDICTED: uncharacterized protein LOC108663640 [Theobroma cacao]|uniref:Uncharacterized protein LOC108663640 n=1 Tax=Theobroma cacao TaxID=3641 RepID=A0AB32X2G3_THECC|nr:PREDICTED: uncharacterized protein LOC108663640 [Theobroma cacao]